jgi:hypothetical protein
MANTLELISSTTLGSAQSSIGFTSIPGTYKSLQIRGINKSNSGGATVSLNMQFNSDTGTNYGIHTLSSDGTTVSAYGQGAYTSTLGPLSGGQANTFGAFIFDILDYASTTKNKTVLMFGGVDENTSGAYIRLASSVWVNTSAITSITMKPASNSFGAGTTFALYGIN